MVTEAATNLVKHARRRRDPRPRRSGTATRSALEILALDRGPGIGRRRRRAPGRLLVGRARAGTGLGAIRRASSEFDVYSTRAGGTAMLAVLQARSEPRTAPEPRRCASRACRCRSRARSCAATPGRRRATRDGVAILVVDGLGHGPRRPRPPARPSASLPEDRGRRTARPRCSSACIAGSARTRGAAAAIAQIDPRRRARHVRGRGQHRGLRSSAASARARWSRTTASVGHEVAAVPGVHLSLARRLHARHALRRADHRTGASTAIPG